MRTLRAYILISTLMLAFNSFAATEVTDHGITWKFDKNYPTGQYATGDWWVVGPVKIIEISNSFHTHGFKPVPGQDGSMVNPPTNNKQGYDKSLHSYDASLNAGLPNGKPVAKDNPLLLPANASLVSSVSWLYESKKKTEPGCPRFNGGTKCPRPVTRAASILTCVDKAPPAGSFRPPYCGTDKAPKYNVSQLKKELLPKLAPPKSTPDLTKIEKSVSRPWIDHVHQYLGAMVHPTENMPEYGKDVTLSANYAALMLMLDFSKLPGAPSKDKLLTGFVQLGIDLAAIADDGGFWPSNGGHEMGRKWPILFAGNMLNDEHMKNVGQWKTGFQEDLDTFYVSEKDVELSHSSKWKPDKRAPGLPYEKKHIGLPEWGIRHTKDPEADNLHWQATYRHINNPAYVGFVLAAHLMGQRKAWNHEPLFDYVDRAVTVGGGKKDDRRRGYKVFGGNFFMELWEAHRDACGPRWVPDNPDDLYSTGKRVTK